jgi:hypothetical protein
MSKNIGQWPTGVTEHASALWPHGTQVSVAMTDAVSSRAIWDSPDGEIGSAALQLVFGGQYAVTQWGSR